MTLKEFIKLWPLLKRQVKMLHVPWLENMASSKKEPFKILISCILSLRTQDRVTGEASAKIFQLASTPEKLDRIYLEENFTGEILEEIERYSRCLWTGDM